MRFRTYVPYPTSPITPRPACTLRRLRWMNAIAHGEAVTCFRTYVPHPRRDRGQAHLAAVFQLGVPLGVSAES